MKVNFQGEECEIEFSKYQNNGRTAIILTCEDSGERMAVATVNVPEIDINENEVIIKDYHENQGILETLVTAGVVNAPNRHITVGCNGAYVCTLTDAAKQAVNQQ